MIYILRCLVDAFPVAKRWKFSFLFRIRTLTSMNTNVSDDLDDVVNACMLSTCDVKPYDFEPLAADTVPSQCSRFIIWGQWQWQVRRRWWDDSNTRTRSQWLVRQSWRFVEHEVYKMGMTINRTGPHRAAPDHTGPHRVTHLLTYLHLAYSHLSQAQFQWSNNNDDFQANS